ncbi:MAG: DUF1588 domain-containing protein [Myxococcales bacterium FL481]|nr:MAG: DUF1588 domain-containing protein [Myxococcales bacterium FL481]
MPRFSDLGRRPDACSRCPSVPRRRVGSSAWILLAAAVHLTGCTEGESSTDAPDAGESGTSDVESPPSSAVALDSIAHLSRVSTALRGIRPAPAQLEAVRDNPDAIPDIVDQYLESDAFGETIRDLHNETLLTRVDYLIYPAGFQPQAELADVDIYQLNREVMDAPLRLISHVVQNDRPYSEIVTADYALATPAVATVWGMLHTGSGWQESRWNDLRGHAGILSDSWLFQRHSSTLTNANRGRANAMSRALLCHDFASRDIEIEASLDLADPSAIADAVATDAACASCHQSLDPLASFFRGFFPLYVPAEVTTWPMELPYVPDLFPSFLGVPMRDARYFGVAADGLPALGQLIASDPRFTLCAARRFYAYFHQIPLADVPHDVAATLQRSFIASGLDAKALTKAIVLADDFRVSHFPTADPEQLDERLGLKKLRPLQMRQLFSDLTGFEWVTDLRHVGQPDLPQGLGRPNLLDDSFLGFQVLAGGVDGIFVTQPAHTYNASSSLVLSTLAAFAAQHVVDTDLAVTPAQRRLLTLVEADTTDEVMILAQLDALHLRLYAQPTTADDPELAQTIGLWRAAFQRSQDPVRAWKTTLTAMLQDVRIAYY